MSESETEFIDQTGRYGVVVRNKEAAVVLDVGVVGKQLIPRICHQILPAKTGIDLLLGADILIDTEIDPIAAAGNRDERLIVVSNGRSVKTGAGKRVVAAQQGDGRGVESLGGNGVIRELHARACISGREGVGERAACIRDREAT